MQMHMPTIYIYVVHTECAFYIKSNRLMYTLFGDFLKLQHTFYFEDETTIKYISYVVIRVITWCYRRLQWSNISTSTVFIVFTLVLNA